MSLLVELKRPSDPRGGSVSRRFVAVVQASSTILPMFAAPDWLPRTIVILLAVGFVPMLVFACAEALCRAVEWRVVGSQSRLPAAPAGAARPARAPGRRRTRPNALACVPRLDARIVAHGVVHADQLRKCGEDRRRDVVDLAAD